MACVPWGGPIGLSGLITSSRNAPSKSVLLAGMALPGIISFDLRFNSLMSGNKS